MSLPIGTIYENDHVTIIQNDGIYNDDIPLFSDSNFKFRIGLGSKGKKRHSRRNFVSLDGTETNVWTLDNLPLGEKSVDSSIVLKPDYSSLKDFAYYGSAVELIKSTVNDVILRYPAGLYYFPSGSAPTVKVGGTDYYMVSNSFNIDFWTPIGIVEDGLENPLRVLGASYMNYENATGGPIGLTLCITGDCLNSIIGQVSFDVNDGGAFSGNEGAKRLLGDGIYGDGSVGRLTITATTMNGGQEYPIENGDIAFRIKTKKSGCIFENTARTGMNGVATVVYPTDNWSGDCSNGELSDAGFWTARYVSDEGNIYYNINGERVIDNNEITDKIVVYQKTPTIHYPLIGYVHECDNEKKPISGVTVVFYIETRQGNMLNSGEYVTDSNGRAYFNAGDTLYLNGNVHTLIKEHPTAWYIKATYNGIEKYSQSVSVDSTAWASVCFDIEDNYFTFSRFRINGIVGSENIGAGNNSTIYFYSPGHSDTYIFNGVTNSNGYFEVTKEEFINEYPNATPIFADAEMTYNGETKRCAEQMFLTTVNNPPSYEATVYFDGGSSVVSKGLIAYVYNVINGHRTPRQGAIVNYFVYTDKNIEYRKSVPTDETGKAVAYMPGSGWSGGNEAAQTDANRWFVTCDSFSGALGNRYIKRNELNNYIEIPKDKTWDSVTVRTIYEGDGNPIANAVCVVCAKTSTSRSWMYYKNGYTDSQGNFSVGNSPSNWIHIPGTLTGITDDFEVWTASADYDGVHRECLEPKQINDNLAIFEFKRKQSPYIPPYSYNCDLTNPFYIYLDGNGDMHLLTDFPNTNSERSVIIRPKKEFRDEFWNNLDDFEKVLLDRNSVPKYKARLESPYISNYQHYYRYKNYIWPTLDGESPDVSSARFNGYLKSLMEIAEYYDEYETDNLWRMMTHESIKNLDYTFFRSVENEDISMSDIDTSRMKAVIRVHGRLYDDIKRYADNIKATNTISYNEKNNVPDYFLSDNIDIGGWDLKSINEFPFVTTENIYPSWLSGKTTTQINADFLRRLALSSEYIMSMKGTKRGVEAILGMFGYENGKDYDIDEFVAIANRYPSLNEFYSYLSYNNSFYPGILDDEYEFLSGYPCAAVSTYDDESYLIPWFNKTAIPASDMYFQEKGGWGKLKSKDINLSITTAKKIEEDFDVNLYSETAPYMVFVSDIEELTSLPNNMLRDEMICYVTDITSMYTIYSGESDYNIQIPIPDPGSSGEEEEPSVVLDKGIFGAATGDGNTYQIDPQRDFSHYFVLKNIALSNYIGFIKNERYSCYGWKNVLLREFKNGPLTADGLRVLYLESLDLNTKGNNPHCGYGEYDEGLSYIEKYNQILHSTIKEGEYEYLKYGTNEDREVYEEILTFGFDVNSGVIDNKKTHYFLQDGLYSNGRSSVNQIINNSVYLNGTYYTLMAIDDDSDVMDTSDYDNFVNPEGGEKYEEAAANSIINTKNLLITFYTNDNEYFEKYIKNVVLMYLKEMIPSTTILKYEFKKNKSQFVTPTLQTSNSVHVERVPEIVVGDMATANSNDIYIIENNEGLID